MEVTGYKLFLFISRYTIIANTEIPRNIPRIIEQAFLLVSDTTRIATTIKEMIP